MNRQSDLRIESDRLLLRRLKETDLDDFLEVRSKPEVARFQSWEPFDRERARAFITEQKNCPHGVPGVWFQFGIQLKSTRKLIGDCAFKQHEDEPRNGEIGFSLNPGYQGSGYATEAARMMLSFLFNDLQLHRVAAITDAENLPSVKVLERLNMRREAHFVKSIWFKGKWGDEFNYAILREEFTDVG